MSDNRNLDSIKLIKLANLSLNSGALAVTTAKAKFKTTASIAFILDGAFKAKGATDNLVFSSGHDIQPADSLCYYVIALDASGNVTTHQGVPYKTKVEPFTGTTKYTEAPKATSVPTVDPNGALMANTTDFLPAIDSALVPVGVLKVTTVAVTFTPGTTEYDASGITWAFTNVSSLPRATSI